MLKSSDLHHVRADPAALRVSPTTPATDREAPHKKEDIMNKRFVAMLIGSLGLAAPSAAHHVDNLNTPFESRGACESAKQVLSNSDDFLLDRFPNIFSSAGEVRSFLNRAFPCEVRNGSWYLIDHRQEVLDSDWLLRRL